MDDPTKLEAAWEEFESFWIGGDMVGVRHQLERNPALLFRSGGKFSSGFDKKNFTTIQFGGEKQILVSSHKRYPLMMAAADNKLEMARWMLDHGANINAMNDLKITALFLAVANSHSKMVQLLIDAGSLVNTLDGDKRTLLHIAYNAGIAQLLLDAGTFPSIQDINGNKVDTINNNTNYVRALQEIENKKNII